MVGNDYDDLKMEYVKLKQQLDTFIQIMPRMGYSSAPLESKEIVTKLDEIKEILSAAAVEEGGAHDDPLVGRLERLIDLLEASVGHEGVEDEEDRLVESLSRVATTMEHVAESIKMNTQKLEAMEKNFERMGTSYSKPPEPQKKSIFEEKIEAIDKEKHESMLDETLDEFSESDFLKKVNQAVPDERIDTIFSKKITDLKGEPELVEGEPSLEDILKEAEELGIDTKELMGDFKGETKKTKGSSSLFPSITLFALGGIWLIFSILFLLNSMGIFPVTNPISSLFLTLEGEFIGLVFYMAMVITGAPPIIFGIMARTSSGSKGSDNIVLYAVGVLWIVSGILLLLFKGIFLPGPGLFLDLVISLILIFSSAMAILMGTEFSRKKISM